MDGEDETECTSAVGASDVMRDHTTGRLGDAANPSVAGVSPLSSGTTLSDIHNCKTTNILVILAKSESVRFCRIS